MRVFGYSGMGLSCFRALGLGLRGSEVLGTRVSSRSGKTLKSRSLVPKPTRPKSTLLKHETLNGSNSRTKKHECAGPLCSWDSGSALSL